MISLSEKIRDYLREHPTLNAPEAIKLWPENTPNAIRSALRNSRDAGVIVPLPGRYPRNYRLPLDIRARFACCHETALAALEIARSA